LKRAYGAGIFLAGNFAPGPAKRNRLKKRPAAVRFNDIKIQVHIGSVRANLGE